MKDDTTVFSLRVPTDLYETLKEVVLLESRSINAHILHILSADIQKYKEVLDELKLKGD